jgi:hypothetical protein
MGRRNADLVDPEVRALVRMDIMDRGGEADDDVTVERDDEVVAIVGEKLTCPPRVDGAIEDIKRNVLEDLRVAGPEEPYLYRHS